ncbi:hypothetical protein Tco_1122782 [Tanacetum coccineum]|uniref:Uncharacterized protein n=1 Tax=Tanacetum coccineum TaxID=301880 RepID=A0ABQ5J1I5_9ASTR
MAVIQEEVNNIRRGYDFGWQCLTFGNSNVNMASESVELSTFNVEHDNRKDSNQKGQTNDPNDVLILALQREVKADDIIYCVQHITGGGIGCNICPTSFASLVSNEAEDGLSAMATKLADFKASSNPNMAPIVEQLVNSSSNYNMEWKSSVQVDEDSESDVEDVYDDTGDFMATKHSKSGSGIEKKSLYERWKDSLDDDPYDDDEYNAYDLSEEWLFVTLWISSFMVELVTTVA